MSPLERSKALLESQGFDVWKVEKPASMYQPTVDLFNCIDLVGIRADRSGVMGIQCCGEDLMPHVHKILEGYTVEKLKKVDGVSQIITTIVPPNPYIFTWLKAGNPFFIWSWRPIKEDRKTRMFYKLREVELLINQSGDVIAQENEMKGN